VQTLPAHQNLRFIEPVGYSDNLSLIKHSFAVLTDSGGMQKEAYMLKKFCITLRDETEWTELTDLECNFLAGAKKQSILDAYDKIKGLAWDAPEGIYGGGKARTKVSSLILEDAARRGLI
jgi:UDP-GlcNAc3NAcA epimerase